MEITDQEVLDTISRLEKDLAVCEELREQAEVDTERKVDAEMRGKLENYKTRLDKAEQALRRFAQVKMGGQQVRLEARAALADIDIAETPADILVRSKQEYEDEVRNLRK